MMHADYIGIHGVAGGMSLLNGLPRKRKERGEGPAQGGSGGREPPHPAPQAPASVSSSAPACTADVSSCATGASAAPTLTLQCLPADAQAEAHVSARGCNPWLELSRVKCAAAPPHPVSTLSLHSAFLTRAGGSSPPRFETMEAYGRSRCRVCASTDRKGVNDANLYYTDYSSAEGT